jgi:formamidopyrimidine-DNA glycosylase
MPELPEVETIRRQLNKLITGKKIKSVDVRLPKIVKAPLLAFRRALANAKIKIIVRRAKIFAITLDNGWTMLIHLKLTGQMLYQKKQNTKQEAEGKYTHIVFYFSDGSRLLFNDLRQFGYIKLIKTGDLENYFLKEKFGPEPLDKKFTLAVFRKILRRRPKAKIKPWLMDQKNIAGIGNIYSDEILFAAGVHPLRRNQTLKPPEIKKIFNAIKKILTKAVKLRGTSASDYFDAYGREGNFLKELKVYGKERENCVKCNKGIKRVKINGRSAHFCPNCQI